MSTSSLAGGCLPPCGVPLYRPARASRGPGPGGRGSRRTDQPSAWTCRVPAAALALAGPDQMGLLVRLDQGAGCLLRMDLGGGIRWRLDFPGPGNYPFSAPRRRMQVAEDGSAWLGEGRTLTRVGTDGRVQAAIDVS